MKKLHTRQFTFRQLEIFTRVAELNSVSDAAKNLHLAQPTVSTQLAKLAQATGHALFEQIGKKLYLTDVGEDVYASSRQLFDVLDNLEMSLSQRTGLSVGRLRLSVVTTAKYLVPNWLGSFLKQYPQIEPEFQIGNRAEIIHRLRNNRDDMYIFSHPPSELDIDTIPISDNPLVCIAPTNHSLSKETKISWDRVRQERFLIREQGSGTRFAVEQFFRSHGAPHAPPITIASNEAIKESVVAELGVAILSKTSLSHMAPDNLVILPVEELPIQTRWYLVTPKGKVASPVASAFKQHIANECAPMDSAAD